MPWDLERGPCSREEEGRGVSPRSSKGPFLFLRFLFLCFCSLPWGLLWGVPESSSRRFFIRPSTQRAADISFKDALNKLADVEIAMGKSPSHHAFAFSFLSTTPLLHHPSPYIRWQVIELMTKIFTDGPVPREAALFIARVLSHRDGRLRQRAVNLAKFIGNSHTINEQFVKNLLPFFVQHKEKHLQEWGLAWIEGVVGQNIETDQEITRFIFTLEIFRGERSPLQKRLYSAADKMIDAGHARGYFNRYVLLYFLQRPSLQMRTQGLTWFKKIVLKGRSHYELTRDILPFLLESPRPEFQDSALMALKKKNLIFEERATAPAKRQQKIKMTSRALAKTILPLLLKEHSNEQKWEAASALAWGLFHKNMAILDLLEGFMKPLLLSSHPEFFAEGVTFLKAVMKRQQQRAPSHYRELIDFSFAKEYFPIIIARREPLSKTQERALFEAILSVVERGRVDGPLLQHTLSPLLHHDPNAVELVRLIFLRGGRALEITTFILPTMFENPHLRPLAIKWAQTYAREGVDHEVLKMIVPLLNGEALPPSERRRGASCKRTFRLLSSPRF